MELIRVEILQHVRRVQLSAKQRPTYFEWNGHSIKGKNTSFPKRFIKNKQLLKEDTKVVKIEDLREDLVIGIYEKNKIIGITRESNILPSYSDLLKDSSKKYRLCIEDVTKDLFDLKSYVPVLSNPRVVNTARLYLIKGQDFYNSKIREFQRGVVMDKIKECYRPYLENLPVINDYPVRIECEVHDTIKNYYDNSNAYGGLGQPWDVDNYAYPYIKAFPDLMQELGKIRNDDRLHITQSASPIFCPIDNHNNRKLVFIIRKDEREIISSNEIYNSYHNNPTIVKEKAFSNTEDPFKDDPLTFEQLNTPYDI